jgi:TetR/AcrR family transcriptional repressor of nem operon
MKRPATKVGVDSAMTQTQHDSKTKFLDAALTLVREKGYAATTIDNICDAAGLTKGSFFHHFDSKDELAVAAVNHWTDATSAFFLAAPYHAHPDPLERVLGYVDFRKSLLTGPIAKFTCFVGTMVQETYDSHPDIRAASERSLIGHAATLEADIAEAMRRRRLKPKWTARDLAQHTQVVLQGAFVLAKATDGAEIAVRSLDHLHRYISLLFEAGEPAAANLKPLKP